MANYQNLMVGIKRRHCASIFQLNDCLFRHLLTFADKCCADIKFAGRVINSVFSKIAGNSLYSPVKEDGKNRFLLKPNKQDELTELVNHTNTASLNQFKAKIKDILRLKKSSDSKIVCGQLQVALYNDPFSDNKLTIKRMSEVKIIAKDHAANDYKLTTTIESINK